MSTAIEIALTAINAFDRKLSVTANNIANVNTDGFKKSRIVMEEKYPNGVSSSIERVKTPGDFVTIEGVKSEELETSNVILEEEMVALITTRNNYKANTKTIKTAEEMKRMLFDILA